jgi:RNA polymerase sigma factor (sigma-70 family)
MAEQATRTQVEILFNRFGALVYRRCRRILGADVDAWAATQEVFARAMRHYASFRAEASPTTWILRISTDHCLNVLRKRRGQRIEPGDPTAEEDRFAAIRTPLTGFDPDIQRPVVHRYMDGMTHPEVAAVCGLSEAVVGKRIQRVVRRSPEPPEEPPASPEGCSTDWTLQRYAVDELVGDERNRVAIHVASCQRCRGEVAVLDRYREEFLKRRPFAEAEAEVVERVMFLPDEPEIEVRRPAWTKLRVVVAASLASAAALAAMLMFAPPEGEEEPPPHVVAGRTTALRAAVLRDGEAQRLKGSMGVHPGDEIEFRVDTATYDHVLVLGMDGNGAVSVVLPPGGGLSVPVDPGAGRTLSPALTLDDAPGPAVYVALFTRDPVASQDVAALVHGWAGEHGARGLAVEAPHDALGGAVEVLLLDKAER